MKNKMICSLLFSEIRGLKNQSNKKMKAAKQCATVQEKSQQSYFDTSEDEDEISLKK